MRKRKGALLRISIEIETTKKSLFYLLAQSVSVYPTSNVGTLVIVRIFRMAEDPAPVLVATPHKAQKTILDQTLRSKRQGLILRAILQPGK